MRLPRRRNRGVIGNAPFGNRISSLSIVSIGEDVVQTREDRIFADHKYLTALLTHYGHWVQPERHQARGPAPKPRWMPLPQLLYAQVIKTTRRRRLVRVSHRMVFGTLEALNQVLVPLGWQINTSLVERVNLSLRQHVAAIGRRTSTLCKGEAGLCQQLALSHVYYNFVLPHASLRQPLPCS
jgi:hypothetical protein